MHYAPDPIKQLEGYVSVVSSFRRLTASTNIISCTENVSTDFVFFIKKYNTINVKLSNIMAVEESSIVVVVTVVVVDVVCQMLATNVGDETGTANYKNMKRWGDFGDFGNLILGTKI